MFLEDNFAGRNIFKMLLSESKIKHFWKNT